MCGIAGSLGPQPVGTDSIHRAIESLSHRGPDGNGSWQTHTADGGFACLIHTRLSIIDLDPRSGQPMHWDGLSLVFNGELYNYRELRAALERENVPFQTKSDTEVLLKGIWRFGWNFLRSAEGMWALALYDARKGTLSLSRDRFGEKPLWYHRNSGRVTFSSTVSALSEVGGQDFAPDLQRIQRFIVLGYRSVFRDAGTFFEGVEEVPSGYTLHFHSNGVMDKERYWHLPTDNDSKVSFDDAVGVCRSLLQRSLELRLRSDAPLAFSLSGGVDSVVLAGLARRNLDARVHGFTIRNSDSRYEEQREVQAAIEFLELDHTWVDLRPQGFIDAIAAMTQGRTSPVLTLSSFAQYQLMERIHQHGYKVVVGGTGADEIFSGYYDHHLFYLASIDETSRTEAERHWNERVRTYVRNPFLQDMHAVTRDLKFRRHIYLHADRFNQLLKSPIDTTFLERDLDSDPLRNRLRNELQFETVPVLLHEEDLNSMAASIENRSPYLDRNLAEYVFSLPTSLLIRRGFAKALLREVGKGFAPSQVLENPRKVGFNVPLAQVIDLKDSQTCEVIFGDSDLWELVDRDAFRSLVNQGTESNSVSKLAFNVLSAKAFLDFWR